MNLEKCFSCGIKHEGVECTGIFHCPNALCRGCGAGWFRQKLNSYEELPCGKHTVNEFEYKFKGTLHNWKRKISEKRGIPYGTFICAWFDKQEKRITKR